jgi:hypothetical protein
MLAELSSGEKTIVGIYLAEEGFSICRLGFSAREAFHE